VLFQLFEVQALLGAIQVFAYLALYSLALILIALVFFMVRRWTATERIVRRRVLKILGVLFLLPGGLIPTAVVAFWLFVFLWPDPKVELLWDLTQDTTMDPFDPERCSRAETSWRCVYQGDITLSIRLPDGRTMRENAKLVWVDGEGSKITSIMIYSVRYDLERVYAKIDEYILEWGLKRQIFEEWKVATSKGETEPLDYSRDNASPTTPRLWIMAKHLEEKTQKPWFFRLELRWD
jgi:hypothetical protein